MGGVDKGLQLLGGRPLVAWVLERLEPQVSEILISANQNIARYESFGHRVLSDEIGGFAGPLAGLERGMQAATYDLIATAPCDSPFLPRELVQKLYQALVTRCADLAVARTGTQVQPVFCLCKRSLHSHLRTYVGSGGRKIDAWYADLTVVEVPFDDQSDAFSNINTVKELLDHEQAGSQGAAAKPGG